MIRIVIIATCGALTACSMLSGGRDDDNVRVVDKEEIVIEKVFTLKERLHCEADSGRPLTETKRELERSGIKVFSSSCALITGEMGPSLCGAVTLHINIHEIDRNRMSDAESLGFRPLASLEENDRGYDPEGCD